MAGRVRRCGVTDLVQMPRRLSAPPRVLGEEDGQMVVEMAVVTPVMIVVAVIVLNLMWFLEASARFDRVALDEVVALAASPSGEDQESGAQGHAVASAIESAMGGMRGVSVSVEAQTVWDDVAAGVGFTFAPHLTRYVCTMTYVPWPVSLTIAGVDAGVPGSLCHERSIVVDRYRSGVLF